METGNGFPDASRMAQYIVIQKLDNKSEQNILQNNVALENILSDLCRNVE